MLSKAQKDKRAGLDASRQRKAIVADAEII